MSDVLGRLHFHLHSRSVLKLWKDKEWAALTPETLMKSDTAFESDLLSMAKPKLNHDTGKGEEDDSFSFDDVLTARKAMQIMEMGPDRGTWADKGHSRLLSLVSGTQSSSERGGSSMSLSFSSGVLR